ncbi:hypothetical protein CAPTEDRAFT_185362 [Capitella teleta]|uniref:Angiotensin-converting enzyme n=1 Tax=Capitella teleta TaxID=283909 RepID=R7TBG0_CAPTE|nr:hypothetical protein CAPTEDRAFT_185362 [Capitella teleta]|eukprot:ELT90797.1 hypothetical protein CAPTEDRAFT_185362 [Capitella teleta]
MAKYGLVLCAIISIVGGSREKEAIQWVKDYSLLTDDAMHTWNTVNWNYQTNITKENEQAATEQRGRISSFLAQVNENASHFDDVIFTDNITKRVFHFLRRNTGKGIVDSSIIRRMGELRYKMMRQTNSARIRRLNCTSEVDCELDRIGYRDAMGEVKEPEELKYMWEKMMDAAAKPNLEIYPEFIDLKNKVAQSSGFNNRAEDLLFYYDDEDFEEQCLVLWKEVLPLYQKLQNFVRHHLKQVYSEVEFPDSGHIPVHLLGGSMGAFWQHLYKDIEPFSNKSRVSFGDELLAKNYTSKGIYKQAESFFVSLGYDPLPAQFWEDSMFEKPIDGREVICGASAWDFGKNGESRIKHCGTVTEMTFNTAHHELGHIYYFKAYAELPHRLRQGANPGFHEAIGDCISLSTETSHYLHHVHLVDKPTNDEGQTFPQNTLKTGDVHLFPSEADVNFLLRQALYKLAIMPFSLLVDTWRYSVYRGETLPHEYNKNWWNLRCKIQGVSPPSPRSSSDFDPAELSHISSDTPYLRYFVSLILQFQFHEALCQEAGHQGPLYTCDIYQSKEAGAKLWSLMELGASKPWSEALQMIAGTRKMNAQPVLEYFKPLSDWLDAQNFPRVTWDEECPDGSFTSGAERTYLYHLPLLVCVRIIMVTLSLD